VARRTPPKENEVRERLISTAQELAQTVGFNAFSYRDLAEHVGIRTASIHYYFPKKEDLSKALIQKYGEDFALGRTEIEAATSDPREQLMRYVSMCTNAMEGGLRVCLCGMFATDYLTLSEGTQSQLRTFILENERWLETVLRKGKQMGTIEIKTSPQRAAKTIFGLLEGMIIIAHCFGDQKDRLRSPADWLSSILV
jgi:TetR/AcrR family transcriptional repressor of nem operon